MKPHHFTWPLLAFVGTVSTSIDEPLRLFHPPLESYLGSSAHSKDVPRRTHESGFDFCEHMRKQAHLLHVPILVTSDGSFPEHMAHAERAGANAFLKKSFTAQSLLKYVSAPLDGPRSSQGGIRRLRIM